MRCPARSVKSAFLVVWMEADVGVERKQRRVCVRGLGEAGRLVVPEVGVGEVGGNGACPGPQVVCFSVLRDGTAGLKLGTGDCWAAHPRDSRGVTKRQHVSSVPRISNRCRKGIAAQWRLILAVRIAASAHT